MDLNQIFPIVDNKASESLKKQFQNILENTAKVIETAIVVIEGETRPLNELIQIVGNKKNKKDQAQSKSNDLNSNDKSLQAAIYISHVNKSLYLFIHKFRR